VDQVSRPVLIALAAVLVFVVAHFTVLAPKSDSGSAPVSAPKAPGQQGLENAIGKADNAVAQSKASATRSEQAAATASGESTAAKPTRPKPVSKAKAVAAPKVSSAKPVKPLPTLEAGDLSGPMLRDLADGKVVVALFFNAHASDDNAVLHAVRAANRRHGRVVVHSIPIDDVGKYDAITKGVRILQTPTVLVMGPDFKATTIVGYTDVDTIDQAVSDAGRFGKKKR
jgi:hypothetical protein